MTSIKSGAWKFGYYDAKSLPRPGRSLPSHVGAINTRRLLSLICAPPGNARTHNASNAQRKEKAEARYRPLLSLSCFSPSIASKQTSVELLRGMRASTAFVCGLLILTSQFSIAERSICAPVNMQITIKCVQTTPNIKNTSRQTGAHTNFSFGLFSPNLSRCDNLTWLVADC